MCVERGRRWTRATLPQRLQLCSVHCLHGRLLRQGFLADRVHHRGDDASRRCSRHVCNRVTPSRLVAMKHVGQRLVGVNLSVANPAPLKGGVVGKDVGKLVATEAHGATVPQPCAFVEDNLSRLQVDLPYRLVPEKDFQRPPSVLIHVLRHLHDRRCQMSVAAVHMIDEHGTTAVDADTVCRCVPHAHLCPPLHDQLHLAHNGVFDVWVLIQIQPVHSNLVHVEVTTGNGLVWIRLVLGGGKPWQQDVPNRFGHGHFDKAWAKGTHFWDQWDVLRVRRIVLQTDTIGCGFILQKAIAFRTTGEVLLVRHFANARPVVGGADARRILIVHQSRKLFRLAGWQEVFSLVRQTIARGDGCGVRSLNRDSVLHHKFVCKRSHTKDMAHKRRACFLQTR
eukprot:m.66506 g.66506  ORF g.66506 m.66506 type:complete len:394 (-) comp8364_c1_seq2:386-1567(-)